MSRKTRNIILITLLSPCIVVLLLSAFGNWWFGGNIKPSLDTQYVPTAQALIENPSRRASFIRSILPMPGSVIASGEPICVTVNIRYFDVPADEFGDWTRFYINNERAPWSGVSYVGPLLPQGAIDWPQFCIAPALENGLHLFEIRIATSANVLLDPNSALTYTWAYEVE